MGFLLGAYAKQMAGKRVRSLQARMVRIQSQLRRATRDIEMREKYWAKIEKDFKNSAALQSQSMAYSVNAGLQSSIWKNIDTSNFPEGVTAEALAKNDPKAWKALAEMPGGDGIIANINSQMTEAGRMNSQMSQALQASFQQNIALQEQMIEYRKEADLQPLKDLEDSLQTEKDSLESQIQLAQADYDACKEMEKAGVKSLTPNYTGQA